MGYTQQQAQEFIDKIAPLIQREAINRGYKSCAAVIAQAVIEGACGTSKLSQPPYNNHFGLKAGSAWLKAGKPAVSLKTKEEYKVGVLTTINDYFRVYASIDECVKGYYDFISTKRYEALKCATDYESYARLLKNAGYATSSTYFNTLCNTVKKYNLQSYDGSYLPTLRKGDKGVHVKTLQSLLNEKKIAGGSLVVDGIFGTLTYNAIIDFQAQYGLAKDGIVGTKTWSKLYE